METTPFFMCVCTTKRCKGLSDGVTEKSYSLKTRVIYKPEN